MKDEIVNKIFDRCSEIDIQLDPNPIERGPNYLNKMVAKCRNSTNEIQKYKRAVLQEKLQVERKLNRKKTEKKLRFNDLMSNDERVTKRSSKSDREAKANNILQDLNSDIDDLESELTDLKHVEDVVESKLRELRDVNRDIRLQKRLIEDEIETGAFWGEDNNPNEGKDVDKSSADFDMSELLEEDEEDQELEDEEYEDLFGEGGKSSEEEYEEALDDISPEEPDVKGDDEGEWEDIEDLF